MSNVYQDGIHKGAKVFLLMSSLIAFASGGWAQGTSGKHWVASWGTAEQLVRLSGTGGFGGRAGPGTTSSPPGEGPGQTAAAPAVSTPGARQADAAISGSAASANSANGGSGAAQGPVPGRGGPGRRFGIPPGIGDINNQTIRMIVRSSVGGQSVRIRLANALGTTTISIGAAHIALRSSDSSINPGSDRVLTFSSNPTAKMYAGEVLVSDPVNLNVPPLADVAVSLYIANDAGVPTSHTFGLRPTYVSGTGDFTGAVSIQQVATTTQSYYWLQGVDVLAPSDVGTLVTFGDSITDGDQSTPDTNHMWPAVLAARLQANAATKSVGVANAGIAGNRITGDNGSGLARVYHDALSVPGVKWITVLEGINDIALVTRQPASAAGPASPAATTQFSVDDLISAYRQIIESAHLHGVKVIGCTMTPFGGSSVYTDRGEAMREAANEWIRHSGAFDAVVDFDAATRDSSDPHRFRAEADSPDMLHPGDPGYKLMADAFDLSIFAYSKENQKHR